MSPCRPSPLLDLEALGCMYDLLQRYGLIFKYENKR